MLTGVIAVGAVYMLPVSVAVYAGGTILASGAILSGANRWNAVSAHHNHS